MKRSSKYKEINVCLLERKVLKYLWKYFKNISTDGVVSNKNLWSMIKPFLANMGHINGEEIILKCDNETITESSVLAEMFNSHYINSVEKNSSHFARDNNVSDTRQVIDLIVQLYLDHSSINRIKTTSKNEISSIKSSSNACGTNPEEIFELLSALDIKKAVGFDMIPLKLVKIAASVLCQPLSIAINNSLSKSIFPDDAKIAMVSPLDKGTKKNDISNFRPVSILTTFSKIYERVTKKLIDKAMDKYLSLFISAYRQNYST